MVRAVDGTRAPSVPAAIRQRVVVQVSRVGDPPPTSVYVAVTVDPPAVEVTVTVPGT
jgi:hypothetical protein